MQIAKTVIYIDFFLGTGSSPTAIAALTSTVNRTTTNLQPLVPIGTQLRMVQFPQQGGPTQIQQTIVQSQRGATPVQIHAQPAQVVQGLQQVLSKWIDLGRSFQDVLSLPFPF